MDAPNFQLKELVVSALDQASAIATGPVMKMAGVIAGILMALHFAQAGLELSDRRPCRLFDPRWWFTVCLLLTMLGAYNRIVVGWAMANVPKQMLNFTTAWAEVWQEEWKAIDQARQNTDDNRKLRKAELSEQTKSSEAAAGSWWSGAMHFVMQSVWVGLDLLVTVIGLILSVVIGVGLCLLMLVQAFWVLGQLLLLAAIGPICLAFGLHEATRSFFWSFFRSIFVYEFMYLPFLGVACSIAGVCMARASSTFGGLGIEFGDGTNVAVHLLQVAVGPAIAFTLVKGAPAVLERVFSGGDGGGAGGAVMDRLVTAGQGLALNLLGSGGDLDKSSQDKDKNKEKVSGDAARGDQ
jgi:hypothetical protein